MLNNLNIRSCSIHTTFAHAKCPILGGGSFVFISAFGVQAKASDMVLAAGGGGGGCSGYCEWKGDNSGKTIPSNGGDGGFPNGNAAACPGIF